MYVSVRVKCGGECTLCKNMNNQHIAHTSARARREREVPRAFPAGWRGGRQQREGPFREPFRYLAPQLRREALREDGMGAGGGDSELFLGEGLPSHAVVMYWNWSCGASLCTLVARRCHPHFVQLWSGAKSPLKCCCQV